MSVFLSPVGGAGAQFFDNNGNPLTGGKLYTYESGTTTPAATYTTSIGNIFHANPIVLDAAGRVPSGGEIWLSGNVSYKFVLKTSADVLLATWDNVAGIGGTPPIIANFTGTGAQTSFAIGGSPTSENATDLYVSGVYQQKNTYSISGSNLVFSEAPPYNASIELSYI